LIPNTIPAPQIAWKYIQSSALEKWRQPLTLSLVMTTGKFGGNRALHYCRSIRLINTKKLVCFGKWRK
jgi:hypothetical protein